MKLNKKNGGISILRILILAFLLIFVLSYFHVDIQSTVENPQTQSNLNYVRGQTESLWTHYLAGPAHYIWQDIFVNLLWSAFVTNMQRIRDGQPTDLQLLAPTFPPSTNG
ncbi:MAG: hypothetical protein NTZ44_03880 [Candidatus Nomurabacteria bacterium]|nr:hypothetical protein [Candidatus Nomurabacteria bacterium]